MEQTKATILTSTFHPRIQWLLNQTERKTIVTNPNQLKIIPANHRRILAGILGSQIRYLHSRDRALGQVLGTSGSAASIPLLRSHLFLRSTIFSKISTGCSKPYVDSALQAILPPLILASWDKQHLRVVLPTKEKQLRHRPRGIQKQGRAAQLNAVTMEARSDGKQLTEKGDDARKAAPVPEKLRILCLHGFRTSGNILAEQVTLANWRPIIDDFAELVFLDGPWAAKGPSDVEDRFPGPYFEWYQANKDWTEAYGTEEAVSHVCDYAALHGPFDGLLGFSQGAALSAALIGLSEKGIVSKIPNINFLVIVGGGRSRAPNFKAAYAGNPITCPSLHVIGDKDFMKPHSEVLAEDFKDPVIIRHPWRHVVPKLGADTAEILKDFLSKQLKFKITDSRC